MLSNHVKYSICVANLNMGGTIEVALGSVLSQLDDRFEMIVVDDGSTDDSLECLMRLQSKYSVLRVVKLEKNPRRTLAETRNISVLEAKGEYCLLHIDCDDYWFPYLKDFVEVFHQVQRLHTDDILLKGHQVNMGKRDFLLKNGPYKFGHMVEDRDMWFRFAKMNALVPIEHVIFRTRMPLSRKQKFQKKFLLTGIILRDEIRTGQKMYFYFSNLWKNYMNQSVELRFYKLAIFPFCYFLAKKLGPIEDQHPDPQWENLVANPVKNAKTVMEMFVDSNRDFPLDLLSKDGYWIFSHNSKQRAITDLTK